MHHHLEIVLPPDTADIEAAIARIMGPFDEDPREPSEDASDCRFWDWYAIGGRWTGEHARADVDPARVELFEDELRRRDVTVSALRAGKPTLVPKSQRKAVDALWREWFPESSLKQCPLFDHAKCHGDVCRLDQIPEHLTCSRLIIADAERAVYMLTESAWNGVVYQQTDWDGSFAEGLKRAREYSAHWHEPLTFPPDSIVVTVDYHS